MALASPLPHPIRRRAARAALNVGVLVLAGGIAVVRWQARETRRRAAIAVRRIGAQAYAAQGLPGWLAQP